MKENRMQDAENLGTRFKKQEKTKSALQESLEPTLITTFIYLVRMKQPVNSEVATPSGTFQHEIKMIQSIRSVQARRRLHDRNSNVDRFVSSLHYLSDLFLYAQRGLLFPAPAPFFKGGRQLWGTWLLARITLKGSLPCDSRLAPPRHCVLARLNEMNEIRFMLHWRHERWHVLLFFILFLFCFDSEELKRPRLRVHSIEQGDLKAAKNKLKKRKILWVLLFPVKTPSVFVQFKLNWRILQWWLWRKGALGFFSRVFLTTQFPGPL